MNVNASNYEIVPGSAVRGRIVNVHGAAWFRAARLADAVARDVACRGEGYVSHEEPTCQVNLQVRRKRGSKSGPNPTLAVTATVYVPARWNEGYETTGWYTVYTSNATVRTGWNEAKVRQAALDLLTAPTLVDFVRTAHIGGTLEYQAMSLKRRDRAAYERWIAAAAQVLADPNERWCARLNADSAESASFWWGAWTAWATSQGVAFQSVPDPAAALRTLAPFGQVIAQIAKHQLERGIGRDATDRIWVLQYENREAWADYDCKDRVRHYDITMDLSRAYVYTRADAERALLNSDGEVRAQLTVVEHPSLPARFVPLAPMDESMFDLSAPAPVPAPTVAAPPIDLSIFDLGG